MEFGTLLRFHRERKGYSLAQLARLVHFSPSYLGKIETGHKAPTRHIARRCDAALDSGGALAALLDDVPTPGLSNDVKATLPVPWMLQLAPGGDVRMTAFAREDAGAWEHVGQISHYTIRSATCDHLSVEALYSFFGLSRALGQLVSPAVLLPSLTAQVYTVRELSRSAGRSLGTKLLLLAARTAEYAGWMSQEAGEERAAIWWTDEAVRLAAEADAPEYSLWAKVRAADLALYRGDAHEVIVLSQQVCDAPVAPSLIRPFAAQRLAQGFGLAGDYESYLKAIDLAERLLAAASQDSDAMSLGTGTIERSVDLTRGWALYDLGRPAEAAALLDEAVTFIPAVSRRSRVRFGVRRALAHAAAGNVDIACELIETLLDEVIMVDSATIRADLRQVRTTFLRWRGHVKTHALVPQVLAALRQRSLAIVDEVGQQ